MAVNDGTANGYPFVNFATLLRGTENSWGAQTTAMVLPRHKFTFLVEFVLSEAALAASQTNLGEFIQNGRIYTSLRRIDHPKVSLKTETLRRYNKYVKMPVKAEFPPVQMIFHDDITSVTMALWKEHYSFYNYSGSVGSQMTDPRANISTNGDFRNSNTLVGDGMRRNMDIHPSIGTTLRAGSSRHFFENIIIYDLGVNPDSINIYYYVNPMITQMDHENLDYFDRSSFVGVSMTMEYENYYYTVGVNRNLIVGPIGMLLNRPVEGAFSGMPGHAVMAPENFGSRSSLNPAEQQLNNALNNLGFPGGLPPIPGLTPAEQQLNDLVNNLPNSQNSFSPFQNNPGFVLPNTMGETQQRLNTVNGLLANPNLSPNTNPLQLQQYHGALQNHLNTLGGLTSQVAQQGRANSRRQQALAATLSAFGIE